MNPDFEQLLSRVVRHRIIEKRTPILEKFAASINQEKLLSVACKPSHTAKPKRCFVNVEERIRKLGGRMLTGWIFHEYEEHSIETEAHAIWIDAFGRKRVDITPHEHQPERLLFLPDPRVAIKRGYTVPPKHFLTDDWRILAIAKFDDAILQLRSDKFNGFRKPIDISPEEYEQARDAAGLPDDVAMFHINKFSEMDSMFIDLYG